MIPASRQDRIKSAKMGGAVLAVLVCAAWRVTGSMTEIPTDGPRRVVVIGGERSALTTLRAESTVASPALPDRNDGSTPPIDPDPFRPLEVATASEDPLATKPVPPTMVGPLAAPLTPDRASAPLKIAISGMLPKTPPALRLTGVVVGSHPTAVVMVGDEEIVMRPGSRLPDGSTLVRIDTANVTVAREGRNSVLWVSD